MRKRCGLFLIVVWAGLLLTGVAAGAGDNGLPGFLAMPGFPSETPAFGVTAAALMDGRFIAWDGDAIFVEDAPGAGTFSVVADGYAGDPGFIAVSPDGETALLGAGFTGDMYLINVDDPGEPEVFVNTQNHFSGAYLNTNQVLFDRALSVDPNDPFAMQPELAILDLSGEPEVRTVVANKGTFSSGMTLSACGYFAYAADGMTGETVRFTAPELQEAFAANAPLDWETDGETFGMFPAPGPSTHTDQATIIFNGDGALTFVSEDAEVRGTADPAGEDKHRYSAVYNPATKHVLATGTVFENGGTTVSAWISDAPFEGLPFGDVNRDGSVNAQDIQLVINTVLGIEPATSRIAYCADINRDGGVNAIDIQLVINAVLGLK